MSPALSPPIAPQLARSRSSLPTGDNLTYEVKLDGFRCLAFVDGDQIYLQSRGSKPLRRYFPELTFAPGRYVLDGEIVVHGADGREDFDALGQRIHPSTSRIERLAVETPAVYVAFDLLATDRPLLDLPFATRRDCLQDLTGVDMPLAVDTPAGGGTSVRPIPSVATADRASRWLREAEGVIAKELDAPYHPGERHGMVKVKRTRTIDAVVVGWRPGKEQETVGALILGLYDGPTLRTVGHCSGLRASEKHRLVHFFKDFQTGERGTSGPSRWSYGRDLQWITLRPELVVEVEFDHVTAGRIRHGAKLKRWREDKAPTECTFEQLSA